jgi:hypothetical protein
MWSSTEWTSAGPHFYGDAGITASILYGASSEIQGMVVDSKFKVLANITNFRPGSVTCHDVDIQRGAGWLNSRILVMPMSE